MIFKTILLLVLLSFIGCTKIGKTPTTFEITTAKFSSELPNDVGTGGVYLYGQSSNGERFGKVIQGTSISETIPNGQWSFYVVAWEADQNLGGVTRCASQKAVTLDGTELNLNLTITKSNCNSADFHNGEALDSVEINSQPVSVFPQFMLESCREFPSTLDVNGAAGGCYYNLTNSTHPRNKGYITSVQVVVQSFQKNANAAAVFQGDEIASACSPISKGERGKLDFDDDNAVFTPGLDFIKGLNIPVGSSSAPFAFKIRAYYGSSSCENEDPRGFKTFNLVNGRLEDSGEVKAANFEVSDTSSLSSGKLYLLSPDQEVCQGQRTIFPSFYGDYDDPKFSGGTGDAGMPFLICTKEQFDSIRDGNGSAINLMVQNFKVMHDLDFSFTAFNPIGSSPENDPQCQDSNCAFRGNFDGGGKVLKNIFLQKDNQMHSISSLGIIRSVVPSSGTSYIANVKLENVAIECSHRNGLNDCNEIGSLVGHAVDTKFENIFANKVHVQGKTNVGGVVGEMNVTNPSSTVSSLKYVFADASLGSEGMSGGSNFGGLVGIISGNVSSISYSAARVSLHARDASNVGGIAGLVNGSKILKSSSRGSIEGSDDVGGLVGRLTTPGEIQKSYSFASVRANFNDTPSAVNGNVGGLIGWSDGATKLERSFHVQGNIQAKNLFDNPNRGLVGGAASLLTCVNSLATHSPVAVNSTSCFSKTVAESMMASTYNNLQAGLVEVVASPNPIFDNFFLITSDIGFDYPRLTWELTLQKDTGLNVAFLERPCSGKLAPPATPNTPPDGSGTQADPYQVCTLAQLSGPNWGIGSNYYKLMRDIDFNSTGPLLGHAGVLSAKFDANKKTFHHVFIESEPVPTQGFRGLWDRLTSTAELKNLDISEFQLNVPANANPLPKEVDLFVGAIARVNEGTISNVRAWGTKLDITKWTFDDNEDYSLNLGGLVGKNSGTITKSEIDPDIQFFHPGPGCGDNDLGDYDKLRLGGIAGVNSGTITKSNTQLWLNWYSNDVACNFAMNEESDEVFIGGVAGENIPVASSTALISETEVKIGVTIQNSPAESPGSMFFGGIAGKNGGTIQDTLVYVDQANFNLNTPTDPPSYPSSDNFAGGIAGLNSASGKVKRSVAQIDNYSAVNIGGIGGLIGKNLNSNITTDITSNLCTDPSASPISKAADGPLGALNCLNSTINSSEAIAASNYLNLIDTNNNQETLTGLNFTLDPMNRSPGVVWYFDSNSRELKLRATEGWFDGIY